MYQVEAELKSVITELIIYAISYHQHILQGNQ